MYKIKKNKEILKMRNQANLKQNQNTITGKSNHSIKAVSGWSRKQEKGTILQRARRKPADLACTIMEVIDWVSGGVKFTEHYSLYGSQSHILMHLG